MLSINVLRRFWAKARSYSNPDPRCPSDVHLSFGPWEGDQLGYIALTPEDAEALAAQLRAAALQAREIDKLREAQAAVVGGLTGLRAAGVP